MVNIMTLIGISSFHFVFYATFFINLVFNPINATDLSVDQECSLTPHKSSGKGSQIQKDLLLELKNHGLYGKKFTFHESSSTRYEFSICGDAVEAKPNATLVRISGGSKVDAIGMRNSTAVAGHFGSWVVMRFEASDLNYTACTNMSTSVMLTCDRDLKDGEFSMIYADEEFCSFVFELRISSVCGKPPGMSGWTVLFIIIMVGLMVYFVAGVVYLRYKKGAKGIDQIPNRTFWFGLGNKLADGCGAVCRCDQFCTDSIDRLEPHSPHSGGYSPIGEGVPVPITSQHYDRDTPLLKP